MGYVPHKNTVENSTVHHTLSYTNPYYACVTCGAGFNSRLAGKNLFLSCMSHVDKAEHTLGRLGIF